MLIDFFSLHVSNHNVPKRDTFTTLFLGSTSFPISNKH